MIDAAQTSAYGNWYRMLMDKRFSPSSAAILDYLALTKGLESPVPYHIWSLLSLTAALCGDRFALRHGPMGRMRLNLGVILTGAPAIRKSTALTVMQKFAEGLPISYGPTDTAGQRQGIMSAMMPRWQRESDDGNTELSFDDLSSLADFDSDSILSTISDSQTRKASEIYFVSKELGRLIASTTRELLDFFTDGMDGEAFHYQLKNQVIKIDKPLINLIGATTPASLGSMMPRGASEHGFLSRLIFVHATHVSSAVPVPKPWDDSQLLIKERLTTLIHDQLESMETEISLSEAAEETFRDLYGYQVKTTDIRLLAYSGRRQTHLLKVAALLAFLRGESPVQVTAADIRLSHAILGMTETLMDRAFYGLDTGLYSRVLCAIAELAESTADGAVTTGMIHEQAGYLAPADALNSMCASLMNQKKLVAHPSGTTSNPAYSIADITTSQWNTHIHGAFVMEGGKKPAADEFSSHRSSLRTVAQKKGDAG
jgi:hypothetical protein